jgi:hypothetical protein
MGFNFTAIAINSGYTKEKIDDFSIEFECDKLKFVKEVNHEEAISNFKIGSKFIDFLFLKQSTLMFLSDEITVREINLKKASFEKEVVHVRLNSFTNFAGIRFYKNMKSCIELLQNNNKTDVLFNSDIDIDYNDGFDLGIKLIGKVLMKNFFEINADEKMYRFSLSKTKINYTDENVKYMKSREFALNPSSKLSETIEVPQNVNSEYKVVMIEEFNYKRELRTWEKIREEKKRINISVLENKDIILINQKELKIIQKEGEKMWTVDKDSEIYTLIVNPDYLSLVNMESKINYHIK